ncbi:DinB family protein [Ferruginibacter lapsinanis]|uniref:DinB family protein n=1 Tax=Ferruginibacter lapsinanis TaxID=563172 RepID=UPI001E56EB25|nr:DinB family protein [Ferruginibacter lapsinanis]UEG49061.1 DinB family protein [Ferruginibacter lapsinanis]
MTNTSLGNYPKYVERYLQLVKEDKLSDAYTNQFTIIKNLLESISEEKANYSYAPGKWTLKDLLQHCIDAERIFCFRALTFARFDKTPLPGFEEDDYAVNTNANNRTWQSLKEEFYAVRTSTEMLFHSFTPEALAASGIANNNESSVISIGFLIIGHLYHHINTIKERYL